MNIQHERDGSVSLVDDFGQVIGRASRYGEEVVWEQVEELPPLREIPETVRWLVRRHGRRG